MTNHDRRRPSGVTPKRGIPTASLRRMLGGYFHQDFVAEYGGPEGAATAFARETAPGERGRAATQLRAVIESAGDIEELRAAFAAMRSGWRPRSVASARDVLAILERRG